MEKAPKMSVPKETLKNDTEHKKPVRFIFKKRKPRMFASGKNDRRD